MTMTTEPAERPERLLYLLQVANASFPTGAFNHSYGFETWIDGGMLDDGARFESACRDWLRFGIVRTDGAAAAHAWRHAAAGDLDALVALDETVGALKLTRESREASFKTGRALLGAVSEVFGADSSRRSPRRSARGAARGIRPSSSARRRRHRACLCAMRCSPSFTRRSPTSSASARG